MAMRVFPEHFSIPARSRTLRRVLPHQTSSVLVMPDATSSRDLGLQQWDFSIFKIIQTSERTHFEFRTEIFNLPNHTNFQVPSGSSKRLGGGSYGFATAAAAPRQIQFGLKFYF